MAEPRSVQTAISKSRTPNGSRAGNVVRFIPVPDALGLELTQGATVTETAITFRGWLGELSDGVYPLVVSPWGEHYLQIKAADILYQLPGRNREDGSSIIWVKRTAQIVKCHTAEAWHFGEEEVELGTDPTSLNLSAAKYPRV